uniref:Sulfatase domain-containing protein n=1 Tax=Rhabditophanes sp. KR3021 TaxID=114890 RepID=A0AC35U521_9BILA
MIIGPLNIGQTNDLNEDKSNGMEKDVINGNTEHTSNRYIPTDDNNNGTEESITGKEYVWSLDDNGSFYYSNQTLTEVPNPKLTKLSSEAFNALDLLSMSDSKVLEDYEFSHMFENKCRWPMLSTTSSDYVALLKHVRHFNCQSKNSIEKLVIQSRDGSFFIGKPENSVISNNINCWSQKLTGSLRPNVKKWKFTGPKVNLPLETHIHIHMDQFVITCIEMNDSLNGNVEGKIVFEEPFASLSNVKKYLKETVRATKFNPSISILAIDSVSRNQFHRHMVKSAKFLAKNKFHLLQGYTKVGDNSAVNMMATFGGLTYDEKARWMTDRVSPSISLGKTNLSQSLIKHKDKFIWQKYREKGCITQYNDDISNSGYGIFQYNPFRGFEAPPTHYYFRPYYEYLYQKLAATGSKCLNGKYLLRIFLNIWERFSHTFAFKCHFSFNFLTKFTHDSANNLELFDEPLVEALERMKYNGVFEETIIIIMGDHGQRVSSIQKTYYGRIEERMPLMAIYLPDSFTKQYKEAVQNLRYNKNRLTSNFDIYETILDIVDTNRLKNMHKDEVSKEKGMSLFRNQISVDRNCFDAKVPENFCVCQENVKAINVSEDIKGN